MSLPRSSYCPNHKTGLPAVPNYASANASISRSPKYSSQALFSGIISLPRKFRFSHPLPFPISFIYFIFSDFASVFCRMGHRCIQDCSRLERQFIRLSGKNIMGKRKELICETTIPKYILYRKAGLNIRPVTGAPCCPETWRPFRRKPCTAPGELPFSSQSTSAGFVSNIQEQVLPPCRKIKSHFI